MPNYYTDRYNALIAHAEGIYDFLTESYMNGFENRLLDYGAETIPVAGMQFVRILQYRKTDNEQTDFSLISAAMRTNLQYCSSLDSAFVYFIVSNHNEYGIYLAVEGGSTEKLVRNLESTIPGFSCSSGFISMQELSKLAGYGGVVCGDVDCQEIMVDRILSALRGVNGVMAIVAVPMPKAEVVDYVDALSSLQQVTDFLLSNESLTYSSQNRKTNRRTFSYIPEIDAYLKQTIEYYEKPNESFWKTCIWYGSDTRGKSEQLGASIASVLNGSNTNATARARSYITTDNPLKSGEVHIPTASYSTLAYPIAEVLRKPSLVSYVSTAHLSNILQFPVNSVNGFDAIELEKTSRSLHLFDLNCPAANGRSIEIGKISESGTPYSIKLNDLMEHLLITGATGAGKTNTVMTLIRGIYREHIPLLIIEPSKKDYWHLASEIKDLNVYSFGRDAHSLRLNPLAPEAGTLIGNHIDSLDYAFSGAFEMEPATKLGLHGLLLYTYEQFGWNAGDISGSCQRPFPKIQDMIKYLPEFCQAKLPYGDEVRNNILGSLYNRLSSLDSGMVGEAMSSDDPITGQELCSGSVLVELDDLSLETKPFVAMLLMIKAEQYLRQRDASSILQNVIVLEEAHNVFASSVGRHGHTAHEQASRYFANMLSQIREYGTGLIIADQGASQIDSTAVSNTKVKIIHGIVDQQDIDQVAFSLGLSDVQRRIFPQLRTGEAVIAVRGERQVSRVQVNHLKLPSIRNIACIGCPQRIWCTRFNSLPERIPPRQSIYAQHIYAQRNKPESLRKEVLTISQYLHQPSTNVRCLLGTLLADTSLHCSEREKRRIIVTHG